MLQKTEAIVLEKSQTLAFYAFLIIGCIHKEDSMSCYMGKM